MPYRNRLLNPDFPLHITARSNNREHFPMPIEETWELFSDYLFFINKCFEIKIHSFVLMPNHFHLIARDPQMKLSAAMNYFMRETSKCMGRETKRINRLWGGRFHSSLIDNPLYYLHAYKYVYRNPVEAGLTNCPTKYRFSTLPSLLGSTPGIIPIEADDTLFENFDGALSWLTSKTINEDRDVIRKALRRKTFQMALDPKTKKPNQLTSADSVPSFFRICSS